jgi:hypothetical protein
MVNGSANANAKPNIPIAGANNEPPVDTSTSKKPIIGPVHEKDTNDKVNAIRNILSTPVVLPALLFTLFVHEEGSVSSNPPRNDAPKRSNNKKNKRLNRAFVERALRALAPKIAVTARPRLKYITTIEKP